MFHKLTCALLSFVLAWSNFAAATQVTKTALPGGARQDIDEQLNAAFERLSQLDSLLDRSHFDPAALLERLDYDPDRIIAYVQHSIRFQAYAGALRGPEGTLISRSGNALDQSLLLAKLLKDAGNEARIARGKLSREHSLSLLASMAGAEDWPSAFGPRDGPDRVARLLTGSSQASQEVARQKLSLFLERARTGQEVRDKQMHSLDQAIRMALTGLDRELDSAGFEEQLLAEQADYFWVEYRNGPTGAWQAVHPAFGNSAPAGMQANEYLKNEIPPSLQHRVRLEAFVETSHGGKGKKHRLMAPWERPAANAAHVPQLLMLMPISDFTHEGKVDLVAGLERAKFFGVYLNGRLAPGANVFTLDGLVAPPDALTGQGAFIAELSGKGEKATEAVSTLGKSSTDRVEALQRVWFEFSIIAPGGKVTTVARDVLSTTEDGQRMVLGQPVSAQTWETRAKAALVQSRQVVVSTGPMNPAFGLAKNFTYLESAKKTIDGLRRAEAQGRFHRDPEVLKKLDPLPDFRSVAFYAMANGSTGFEPGGASYLARPMIATFNRGVQERDGGLRQFEQTDIVFNARRSLQVIDRSVRPSPERSARRGLWDTYVESIPVSAPTGPASRDSAFSKLSSGTVALQYIPPSQVARLDQLGLEPSVALLAKNELNSGSGLLLPSRMSKTGTAFWRVDVDTGTLTGMMVGPGGYGGASFTEWLQIVSVGLGVLTTLGANFQCWQNHSGQALECCVINSTFTGAVMIALGLAVGRYVALVVVDAARKMEAATEAGKMVAAVANAISIDTPLFVASFSNFRIKLCGS